MQRRRKFHDIGAELLPRDHEFGCQTVNNAIERLLFFEHIPYSAADRIDTEAHTLTNIEQYSAILSFTMPD